MKNILSIVLICALLCAAFVSAEELAEYRDDVYSFRYPASWDLQTADNGDIVLLSPDEQNGVITFCVITDLISFTGDPAADEASVQAMISGYSGNSLSLNGTYDSLVLGDLAGFRAYGSWSGALDAAMVVLTGNKRMISFVMIGDQALALEETLLDFLTLPDIETAQGAEGFLRWDTALFSIDYPENYGALDPGAGMAFVNYADPSNIIMARTYTLDFEFRSEYAQSVAASVLPSSTGVKAEPVLIRIGGRDAAVIKGTVSGGPMEFYVIGSGYTWMALLLTGEEACSMAETLIRSVEFK